MYISINMTKFQQEKHTGKLVQELKQRRLRREGSEKNLIIPALITVKSYHSPTSASNAPSTGEVKSS